MFRCENEIYCVVPDISTFNDERQWIEQPKEVEVSLVRHDGVIYSTGLTFTYIPIVTYYRSSEKPKNLKYEPS